MAICVGIEVLSVDISGPGSPVDLPVLYQDTSYSGSNCPGYFLYTAAEATPVYTTEEVVEISSAVVLVWATVWAIKVLRRAF